MSFPHFNAERDNTSQTVIHIRSKSSNLFKFLSLDFNTVDPVYSERVGAAKSVH